MQGEVWLLGHGTCWQEGSWSNFRAGLGIGWHAGGVFQEVWLERAVLSFEVFSGGMQLGRTSQVLCVLPTPASPLPCISSTSPPIPFPNIAPPSRV